MSKMRRKGIKYRRMVRELYLDICRKLAESSKDTRLKVGALLLRDDRIVATGYNGQLSGAPHEPVMINGHDISTVHAEMNILAFCAKNGIPTAGCDMIVTHIPCQICTKLLVSAGIDTVYYIEDYRNDENPFLQYLKLIKVSNDEKTSETRK